ncbi:hypothetical protein [Paenibacillus eucommiae]|uniref:Alpha-L-rhamnosidase n=1 Tax=Paenibacillus eucommiae TaxID=1355755 RepID=A0ABS4IT32_9BACL|nr:hypothetical protein [Paenibacillus eucommiae]MBP1990710.1 hypothetical protein [Paenibacillus eucommiae]
MTRRVEQVFQEFQHPSSKFRGKPFWSWNGKLEKEELLRQIGVMQQMGLGGFTMHSRTGLATEYLSEEWFELIEACAAEGERLGLEAWLYDEDRWPSGSAGGMVTEDEQYRMKYLMLDVVPAASFEWTTDTVAAFEADLDGVRLQRYEALNKGDSPSPDSTVLVFRVESMRASSFFNGNCYLDTMKKEAAEKFIESTHEKYKQRMGERFGKSIQAIFTDEPYRGEVMSNVCRDNSNPEWGIPWTEALFHEFQERFQYDLRLRLPEVFLLYGDEEMSEVKWHYMELIQQLFLNNFAKPLYDWCRENKLLLTGHVWHEDSLTAQTIPCGSVMRYYEYMDIPGVDVLTENNRNYWIVKQLTSAARQLGKHWLLSELYGCTGWQMSFESHKRVGDWQALFGINVRSHHLSWYTMKGEAKRDYPGSIFHQSAWWEDYAYVESYFARIGAAMSEGTACCDTLVMNPVESVWGQVHPGWTRDFKPLSASIQQLETRYEQMFHWLSGAQIDFDYGDEEMLSRLGHVGRDEAGLPYLQLGEARYKQVVIAGMTTIRSTTLQLLSAFMEQGGKVIFAGDAPAYVDARRSEQAEMLSGQGLRVTFEQQAVTAACEQGIGRRVKLCDKLTGQAITDIYVQVKELDDALFVLAVNMNGTREYEQVLVTVEGSDGFVQEWHCQDGTRSAITSVPVSGEREAQGIEFGTRFYPGGERLFVMMKQQDPELTEQQVFRDTKTIALAESYAYALNEPNVLVLDRVRYQVQGEWMPETDVLKADQEIRRRLQLPLRGGEMVQPWFRELLEQKQAEAIGSGGSGGDGSIGGRGSNFSRVDSKLSEEACITLVYEFDVEVLPQQDLELVAENPELFTVKVNGVELNTGDSQFWIDVCFKRVRLPIGLIQEGRNEIALTAQFHEGVDLEAIYVLGGFGVKLEGTHRTIVRLPERLAAQDLTSQGLPFYSGKITYRLEGTAETGLAEISLPGSPDHTRCFVKAGRYGGACIKVNPEGAVPQLMAWQPNEADITDELRRGETLSLELTLTRRNTFGPLHHHPLYPDWYGPEQFISEGDFYREDYALVPTGLLEAPVLVIKERL